jgi:hypothetical protein
MYERTCQDDGQAFLGDLEDLLFTRFPEFNQYRALKLLGEDVLDRLYDDEPIRMEVTRPPTPRPLLLAYKALQVYVEKKTNPQE